MTKRLTGFINYSLMIFLLSIILSTTVDAQVKSRIVGKIIDGETNDPLIGANVMVKGTTLGAATNIDGQYFIINVPVGTYTVEVSMVGFAKQTFTSVLVSADRVTKIDVTLMPASIMGEEVTVIAEKSVLHKEVSNTQMVVSQEQMQEASGIREINAFLERLPGVGTSDNGFLEIRGGSSDQTGSMVNGLSYVNSSVGNAETSIPLSAVDQVSLMSGGYNAEYGNFRSGLINITTKSGTFDGYHGTVELSMSNSLMRRFGDSFYDPHSSPLKPYLDADVAFVGTEEAWAEDPYLREQFPRFDGWNKQAEIYNMGKPENERVTPLDLYLFGAWMHMAEPDYEGLGELGYTVSQEHRNLFADHRMPEDGNDWNIDGGFGGPIPLIGKALGNATFFISHNSRERHYVMPLTLRSDKQSTTFATIKMQPWQDLTISYNGLWKYQKGLSPVRPAFGDAPNAGRAGGFMPVDNIRYQAQYGVADGSTQYWYDQAFYPILEQDTYMNGITINHVLSNTTFWELTLGYLQIYNSTPTGDNRDTSYVTSFGPIHVDMSPYGKLQDLTNHDVNGFRFPNYDAPPGIGSRRYRRKEGNLYDNININQFQAKAQISSQLNEHHYVKAGIEYNYIDLNHKFWEKWNENAYNVYEFNFHRWPSQTGVFLQDQVSYEGIVANLGLRLDYYYGGGGLWPTGDPFAEEVFRPQVVDSTLFDYLAQGNSFVWDTWEAYNEENPGFLQPIKNHLTLSPRIGVSFPVTENSKFYFNYGQFRSNPPYATMYQFRYRYNKNGVYDMSNPNLEPPRTTSYELGIAYNFYDAYLLKLSGYYKDVTGQTGDVNYRNAAGTLDYDLQENNEYEDIQGVEIVLSKSDYSWFNMWINFNYMLKKTGLTGRSIVTDITINNDQEGLYQGQESRTLPQPRLNASLTFRSPERWGPDLGGFYLFAKWNATFFVEWREGGYFTYNPLGKMHISSNMQWPDYFMVDLKLSKSFDIGGVNTTFFLDVSNLFNIQVSLLHREYAFDDDNDLNRYLASLRLPMYDSPEFDALREKAPGYYVAGDDDVGDLRSSDKNYINDPNREVWLFGYPRELWFGMRVNF